MVGKVLLFLALVCYATGSQNTCQQGGQYCLIHSECCSKTCLSFLYRCSHISATIAQEPVISTRFDSGLTIDDIIDIAFQPRNNQRSGGRSRNEISSRFRRQSEAKCKEIGEKCYFNEDCCTSRCHGFLHQCVT